MEFKPQHIRTFMGGDFNIGQPGTVKDLRKLLGDIDKELEGWGDDLEIAETHLADGTIRITLTTGVAE